MDKTNRAAAVQLAHGLPSSCCVPECPPKQKKRTRSTTARELQLAISESQVNTLSKCTEYIYKSPPFRHALTLNLLTDIHRGHIRCVGAHECEEGKRGDDGFHG